MPETRYLPVHSGMPTPASSSRPVALTTIPDVENFLAGTPFASKSITDLTGGNANYAYRIHLVTPYEGEDTVVVKHAQPYVRTWTSLAFDVSRQVSKYYGVFHKRTKGRIYRKLKWRP
jgi:5-methylthioribose kinase